MRMRIALGDVIREIRLEQGRTLRDVSKQVPMALGYLSEIERGQKDVSSEILDNLAVALKVPTYQLIIEAGYLMVGTPSFVPVELELERV